MSDGWKTHAHLIAERDEWKAKCEKAEASLDNLHVICTEAFANAECIEERMGFYKGRAERADARIAELEAHVAALQEKFDAETSCGCSYDDKDDVCMGHSPKLAAALARAEKAEAEIARLREVLEPFSDMAGEMFARGWDASNVALALDNPGDEHRVLAGDFFRVRAALKEQGQAKPVVEYTGHMNSLGEEWNEL